MNSIVTGDAPFTDPVRVIVEDAYRPVRMFQKMQWPGPREWG